MLPVNGNVNAMPRKISCKLEIGGNTITNVKMLTYASDWSGDITIGQVVSSYISATIPTPSFGLTGASVSHSMGIFNQNGLGHIQRATTSDPFSQVNVALTREGTVVAERIAGQKISGVKIESTSKGAGSQPQVVVEDGNYTINRVNNGSVTNIGAIAFKDRTSADGTNTIAIQVQEGNAVTIGTKGVPGVSNDNPEFFYYSDPSAQGREKFMLWNGNVRLYNGNFIAYGLQQQGGGISGGDVRYGVLGTESLLALKDTVDSMLSALIGINTRLDDLERRVTDLENR